MIRLSLPCSRRRSGTRKRWVLVALLAGLIPVAARPAVAGPRVTLRIGRASLHEVLMRLAEETGYRFAAPGGVGQPGYKDPPGAKRLPVTYENAPLGRVIREVAAAHEFQPRFAGGYVLLVPRGGLVLAGETAAGPRGEILVSVQRLSQSEYREIIPGADVPRDEKSLDLRLMLRAVDGEGDRLGAVKDLTLVDPQGRVRKAPVSAYNRSLERGLPDERFLDLSLPWDGEHAPRLKRLEGRVELYTEVAERKVEIPLGPASGRGRGQPLAEAASSPFMVKVLRLGSGTAVSARIRVDGTPSPSHQFNEQGQVRVTAILADGRRAPLSGEVRRGRGEPSHVLGDFFGPGNGPVSALEVIVPMRGSAVLEVPFALSDVVLPFGRPYPLRVQPLNEPLRPLKFVRYQHGPRTPAAFLDPAGGTLRIERREAPAENDAETQVGLRRKLPTGTWGAVHWVSIVSGDPWLELEDLAPGIYRVQMRGGAATGAPPAGGRKPLETTEITIQRGKTRTLIF